MKYFIEAFKKYAVFEGRTSRRDYWVFVFLIFILAFFVQFISLLFNLKILFYLYILSIIIPSISISIRRMHDCNKSLSDRAFSFGNLISPFVSGTKGKNRYGSDPRELETKGKDMVAIGVFLVAIFFLGMILLNFTINKTIDSVPILQIDKSVEFSEQNDNHYRNTKYKFKIDFPDTWDVGISEDPNVLIGASKGSKIMDISIQEIPFDNHKTTTVLDVLPDFREKLDAILSKSKNKNMTLIEYGETSVSDEPVLWYKISIPQDDGTIILKSGYQLFKNNFLYLLTLFSAPDEFDEAEKEFMKSFSTFAIEE